MRRIQESKMKISLQCKEDLYGILVKYIDIIDTVDEAFTMMSVDVDVPVWSFDEDDRDEVQFAIWDIIRRLYWKSSIIFKYAWQLDPIERLVGDARTLQMLVCDEMKDHRLGDCRQSRSEQMNVLSVGEVDDYMQDDKPIRIHDICASSVVAFKKVECEVQLSFIVNSTLEVQDNLMLVYVSKVISYRGLRGMLFWIGPWKPDVDSHRLWKKTTSVLPILTLNLSRGIQEMLFWIGPWRVRSLSACVTTTIRTH
jgi:hypothetical protein